MTFFKRLIVLSLLAVAFGMPDWRAAAQTAPEDRPAFERDTLSVETRSGRRIGFDVELAQTAHQRAFGLMWVESLPADQGMLFLFDEAAPRSFWMRNTLIPLDIIFIDESGAIINIAERAIPGDERPGRYVSDGPAAAVLEINGGVSSLVGIRPGDKVIHPAFEADD